MPSICTQWNGGPKDRVLDIVDEEIFLGRQPILNAKRETVAYEILFRSKNSLTSADITDDLASSTHVIVSAMSHFGLESVLGQCDGFINVNADLLMSDAMELLPPERIVLELLEHVQINQALVDRCNDLKSRGFRLALDDFSYRSEYDAILPLVDFIKVDLRATPCKDVFSVLSHIRRTTSAIFLAEKVETEEEFEACKDHGYTLFQGYFFSRPTVLRSKKLNSQKHSLMHIIGILFGDASVNDLEPIFKDNPELILGLLRLVNSVGIGGGRLHITTVRQALVILGQKQLLRWMLLLVYAEPGCRANSELIQRVINRASFMELLTQHAHFLHSGLSDQAHMVGMLSLAHTVIQDPLEELLDQIGLADHLKSALLRKEGALWQALLLTEAIEAADFIKVDSVRHGLGLSVQDITEIQLQAISRANEFSRQLP
ncbi:hypothetical protein CBI30_05120 [Polynucleobacter aenigmaticus]|uniref:Diguanylate phosphodiesterase n=1 Tax=Polynucleobacter aenigmaticus TaxID=1743164 RepID=A0A254PZW7_9BURK|nr:EAL domain-containing protein [Polynucleobacter aenigmaticus]OWS71834.1 hypothetical protein CBI30_05120 [Polynucleobacter aenigmaticus]